MLFTGGDPMIMRTEVLRRWVEPFLAADLEHIATLRFGTKALSYWPARFTTDADADDLLRLLERCVNVGQARGGDGPLLPSARATDRGRAAGDRAGSGHRRGDPGTGAVGRARQR